MTLYSQYNLRDVEVETDLIGVIHLERTGMHSPEDRFHPRCYR
jgi:hypothetical protein